MRGRKNKAKAAQATSETRAMLADYRRAQSDLRLLQENFVDLRRDAELEHETLVKRVLAQAQGELQAKLRRLGNDEARQTAPLHAKIVNLNAQLAAREHIPNARESQATRAAAAKKSRGQGKNRNR